MEIVLVRHGKPISASNPKLDVVGYAKWIKNYNASLVAECSRPLQIDSDFSSFYCVASDYKRAIHSAKIYLNRGPELTDRIYREMDIPRYKLPVSMRAWTWVYVSRALWMLGIRGPFESFQQAKQRADEAANKLLNLADEHQKVIVFGHGFMNRYIRIVLRKKGWLVLSKSDAYWGISRLSKQKPKDL